MDYSKSSNGRINFYVQSKKTPEQPPDISNLFSIYDKIPANQCTTLREPTIGQWENTPLSNAYFSQENIQIIQNGIRAGVYAKSNRQYIIGPQNCDSIKVIMRAMFLQHSINNPDKIQDQINALNRMVLEYCIPKVYSEAQGYLKYLSDVSTLSVPIDHPIMVNQNDKRTHKMPNWF